VSALQDLQLSSSFCKLRFCALHAGLQQIFTDYPGCDSVLARDLAAKLTVRSTLFRTLRLSRTRFWEILLISSLRSDLLIVLFASNVNCELVVSKSVGNGVGVGSNPDGAKL